MPIASPLTGGLRCFSSKQDRETPTLARLGAYPLGRSARALAIQYNYLAEEHDRRTMVEGMKILRHILNQPALNPWHGGEHFPGERVRTDDEWLDYCRNYGVTIYHPSCTVKIGHGADATLDLELRVKGLKGLRVVDASVMPHVVSGDTNAAVVAIAQKAADLILAT